MLVPLTTVRDMKKFHRELQSWTSEIGSSDFVANFLLSRSTAVRLSGYTKQNVIQIFHSNNGSTPFNYSYNIHTENFNALSLRKVASYATEHFQGLENFELFKSFYGQSDYADRWAMAAVESGATGFRSG